MSLNTPILLPECFFLQDQHGYYLRVNDNFDNKLVLTAKGQEPDALSSAFKALKNGDSGFCFQSVLTGKYWNLYQDPSGSTCIACTGQFGDATFSYIHTKSNVIYVGCGKHYMSCNPAGANAGFRAPDRIYKLASSWTVSEAVLKTEISNVIYDISSAETTAAPPTVALSTTVRNDTSAGNLIENLAYSYTRSKVGTWNSVAGITIGATVTFEADVPFVGDAKFSISRTGSYKHSWGGSETVTETVTSTTSIQVPPLKKGTVLVLVRNAKLSIPFTYTEKKWFLDGTNSSVDKKGIYKNVDSYLTDVQAGDWEDVTSVVSIR